MNEFEKIVDGMGLSPVVRQEVGVVRYNDIDSRMGDIMRSVKRLDLIRAGEYIGEQLVSIRDEIQAIGVKKQMLELLGRWAKYEQPDVTNNNIQININRTSVDASN